jgi:excisionase family DNA binding protein
MILQHLEISPNTYYTPDEVATMLRVSRRRVHNLLEIGLVSGIKIGRNWRILGYDLLQLSRPDEISDLELTQVLMRLSAPAFMKVWDNDEDAIYDAL